MLLGVQKKETFPAEIQSGALISIDMHKSRVRILPFE